MEYNMEDEEDRRLAEQMAAQKAEAARAQLAADIIYESRYGRKSPAAAFTQNMQEGAQDPIKQYLQQKKEKRQLASEDADRKFKIAEYMENKKRHEEKMALDKSQFTDKLSFDRWKAEQEQKSAIAKAEREPKKSVAQLEKEGLANIGETAEGQYQEAIKKKDYDPTSYGDFLDNDMIPFVSTPNFLKSDGAIAAKSAQDSWIESYLRDASGAAIPVSERDAYRKIYFPVPGNDKQTVQNKMALRQRMQDNARLASGGGQGVPRTETAATSPASGASGEKAALASGKVKVSNGAETLYIDPADLADATKDGYKEVK